MTREDLSRYYDSNPLEPLSADVARLTERLAAWSERLRSEAGASGSGLAGPLEPPPKKIDQNMWRNRYYCEELVDLLGRAPGEALGHRPEVRAALGDAARVMELIARFQADSTDRVGALVRAWMPQDFRGQLIETQRAAGESKRQAEVAELVAGGGSIRAKYDLYWEQQMARRKTLELIGSGSGVFKYVVSMVAGVPEELLDFVKSVNDPNGPMEEQRVRYGPALYQLTALAGRLFEFVALWWEVEAEVDAAEAAAVLGEAAAVYGAEGARFVEFLSGVFLNSPFLLAKPEGAGEDGPYGTEVNVPAAAVHEEEVRVGAADEGVAWAWSVDPGYDINFEVAFRPSEGGEGGGGGGERVLQEPLLAEEHAGQAFPHAPGTCVLRWDNTHSWMWSKNLVFSIAAVPKEEAIAASPAGEGVPE